MAKTDMKRSLKTIHVCKGKVDENEVQAIFDRNDFTIEVKATYDSPKQF